MPPPELRVLGPLARLHGADDALQAVNTGKLPDGALAVVNENRGLYWFDRESTLPAIASQVIVPGLGAPGQIGRWIEVMTLFGNAYAKSIQLTLALADVAVISNTWTRPSGAVFEGQLVIGSIFTLDTATGRMTYNGPSGRTWEITVAASIGNAESAAAIHLALAASVNGDVTGTDDFAFQQESFTNAAQNIPTFLHAVRVTELDTADTIDPVFKNITAGDLNLNIQKMVMTLRPLP